MYTITEKLMSTDFVNTDYVPATPRGRALFTIDYFLNGRPTTDDHDSKLCTLARLAGESGYRLF